MRYISDIPDSRFKIGLYAWNNKYIVKIEAGMLEQTYKISELDVTGPDEVRAMLDEAFLDAVALTFQKMATDWEAGMMRTAF